MKGLRSSFIASSAGGGVCVAEERPFQTLPVSMGAAQT
jgi:hypothetical protein